MWGIGLHIDSSDLPLIDYCLEAINIDYYHRYAPPKAFNEPSECIVPCIYGTNIVNVILVDFCGFDRMV
jgi:uncharacterized protein (DUF1684 family)